MGSLLASQISSPEEVAGNEKEPIMPVEGKQENGSHGDGFLPITAPSNGQGGFFSSPLSWLKVLAKETHWSFVFGVIVVYGISQGLGGGTWRVAIDYYWKDTHWSFVFGVIVVYGISQGLGGGTWRVAIDYYWKDVQLVQPSAAQVYQGIIYTPWIVKPFWGLLTDVLPVAGYRRKPYLIFAGLLGLVSMLTLSLSQLQIVSALLAMTAGSAGVAIADVTIDACVAQNSIASPFLAADMQSLCGLSSSIGSLLGFSISGVLIHAMGSQGVLGLLSLPSLLVLLVGVLIKESRVTNFSYNEVHQKFLIATKTMWSTLKCPEVWRPCLYMYFSLALSLNIQEGMFYWYTDPKAGPSFQVTAKSYL
ncbi:hypothetical protein HPP92_016853 [Vanilla planifolia]|uniref:Folate-biopterin transporter 2 n=1 Tax=Vanilla planifolia TaxID=51239 RepID=A0A835QP09_VANPL|nr:hypothetical protein HPP92_016853 [Vanilla planifolia]